MNRKLKDITSISSGVTFRFRLEPIESGNVHVIQMKDLGYDSRVHLKNTIKIKASSFKEVYKVKKKDIIFRSRGLTTTAAIISESINSDFVLSAPLFRVRADQRVVYPEYLLWYINHPISQSYFASRSKGTLIKMISRKALEELEIKLPDLDQQKNIIRLYNLASQEQRLLEGIKAKKKKHVQKVLMNLVLKNPFTQPNNKRRRYV